MSQEKWDHFKLFRAFTQQGHFKHLRPTEAAVWMVMLSHANRKSKGMARPSAATVAREIGLSKATHVHAARAELARKGYLIPVSVSGGRAAARYVVSIPPDSVTPGHPNSATPAHADSEAMPTDSVTPDLPKGDRRTTQRTTQKNNTVEGEATPVVIGVIASLPSELASCVEFVNAWQDWLTHRRETSRPLPATQQRAQLEELTNLANPTNATKAVRDAIAGNFAKPYTDKLKSNKPNDRASRTSREFPEPNNRHRLAGFLEEG